ncbi:MAG: helix-turn-helix domain-containing protein [Syntrophomonas sp.]
MVDDKRIKGSFPPWSRIPSLAEMTSEAGINFDCFVQCIKEDLSIEQMADKFKVSHTTIESLQDHFLRYGISSVMGGD